ncbi:hypothetical protein IHQ71_06090 [Rhizobium sp. TH2]|uniref:hypothetical protein n=1 Tax=Rhizobium sp. TH2 TaxID=2775403 RepID=UPI002157779A|nr:hypothetical protein [Rhizobium sp. TH2]UVC10173.1 hypothetical protein IHQ71_06090 [Rhizobium sp. TH2]
MIEFALHQIGAVLRAISGALQKIPEALPWYLELSVSDWTNIVMTAATVLLGGAGLYQYIRTSKLTHAELVLGLHDRISASIAEAKALRAGENPDDWHEPYLNLVEGYAAILVAGSLRGLSREFANDFVESQVKFIYGDDGKALLAWVENPIDVNAYKYIAAYRARLNARVKNQWWHTLKLRRNSPRSPIALNASGVNSTLKDLN